MSGGGNGSALPSSNVPYRCLVPTDAVGLLVGRGGANVRQISKQSGAEINLSGDGDTPPSLSDRIVTIHGDVAQKKAACRLIVHKLYKTQEVHDGGEGIFVVVVPSSSGALISAKLPCAIGTAEVVVEDEVIGGTDDLPVRIMGSLEATVEAAACITALLQDLVDHPRQKDEMEGHNERWAEVVDKEPDSRGAQIMKGQPRLHSSGSDSARGTAASARVWTGNARINSGLAVAGGDSGNARRPGQATSALPGSTRIKSGLAAAGWDSGNARRPGQAAAATAKSRMSSGGAIASRTSPASPSRSPSLPAAQAPVTSSLDFNVLGSLAPAGTLGMQSPNEVAVLKALLGDSNPAQAKLTVLLPGDIVQSMLVPHGHLEAISKRSGSCMELADAARNMPRSPSLAAAKMQSLTISGTRLGNSMAVLYLQELLLQHGSAVSGGSGRGRFGRGRGGRA